MGRTPQKVVDLLHAEIPAKISRNKFCILTGINQNSIDKYMAGIAEPTQATLKKLADYFKMPVPELRGEPRIYSVQSLDAFKSKEEIFEYLVEQGHPDKTAMDLCGIIWNQRQNKEQFDYDDGDGNSETTTFVGEIVREDRVDSSELPTFLDVIKKCRVDEQFRKMLKKWLNDSDQPVGR